MSFALGVIEDVDLQANKIKVKEAHELVSYYLSRNERSNCKPTCRSKSENRIQCSLCGVWCHTRCYRAHRIGDDDEFYCDGCQSYDHESNSYFTAFCDPVEIRPFDMFNRIGIERRGIPIDAELFAPIDGLDKESKWPPALGAGHCTKSANSRARKVQIKLDSGKEFNVPRERVIFGVAPSSRVSLQ